jgi:pyridoxal phosphate enzyme (YggS family)
MQDITENFIDIQNRLSAGVTLVAVSKQQPPEKIQAALDFGHRVFGENYVNEAYEHWAEHRLAYPDLRLHLIGPLQTNKVKKAVALFDVIETVDRPALVDAIVKCPQKPECFIQVNIGDEPQKSGVKTYELRALYDYAVKRGLYVTGLMCIPPVHESSAHYFNLLAAWSKALGVQKLSMGMSGDFEEAIKCGATHVRVGSALFGERAPR